MGRLQKHPYLSSSINHPTTVVKSDWHGLTKVIYVAKFHRVLLQVLKDRVCLLTIDLALVHQLEVHMESAVELANDLLISVLLKLIGSLELVAGEADDGQAFVFVFFFNVAQAL